MFQALGFSYTQVQVWAFSVAGTMSLLLGPASVLEDVICFSLKPLPSYGWKPLSSNSPSAIPFLHLAFSKVFLPQPLKWEVTPMASFTKAAWVVFSRCVWGLFSHTFYFLQNICGNNPVGKIVVLIFIFLGNQMLIFCLNFLRAWSMNVQNT